MKLVFEVNPLPDDDTLYQMRIAFDTNEQFLKGFQSDFYFYTEKDCWNFLKQVEKFFGVKAERT